MINQKISQAWMYHYSRSSDAAVEDVFNCATSQVNELFVFKIK